LVSLRESGEIDPHMYRMLYRKAAGGQFRNVGHLKAQLEIISGRMK
jgi:large subunit ribosomal protein L19e